MFAMSVKLACGESVTIEPRLIGVPVAVTPGLVPHCDVLTVDALAELVALAELAGALEAPFELELELELLQPAAAIAMAAASTIVLRAEATFGTGICALISPPFRW
jgi:hypothetical protein